MIDLSKTRFIIFAWPNHQWSVELIWFIEHLMKGIEPAGVDYRDSINKRNIVCARNWAVLYSALGSSDKYEHFVFSDNDIRPDVGPNSRTTTFLELDADIKCCQVHPCKDDAWTRPDTFHDALWSTSREVLQAIKPPWFTQKYNSTGTEMDGCMCSTFRQKAIDAGFTIAHGGWARHDSHGSWCG